MADTPNPYDADVLIDSLAQSRQSISDALQNQEAFQVQIQGQITASAQQSTNAINEFRTNVLDALNTNVQAPTPISLERTTINIDSVVAPMREALELQLTNMKNAYTSQSAVQAKQLDAAVGAGAFGGNSYRAQQAYQSSMNSLFSQTMGALSTSTLNAEQSIMGAVSQLTGLQGQIDFDTISTEAQLNTEQNMRFRELQANREVALLGLLGNVSAMTIEAGSVLTNNWLNLFNMNNQSVNTLIRTMADLDITEAGIRQTLARDIFQAEMNAINNNTQLQIAYTNAAAQEFTAIQQSRASRRASQAQEYVAEINANTQLQIAEIQGATAIELSQAESQSALELIRQLGVGI